MLTDIITYDQGPSRHGDYYIERIVIVRAMVTETGREIEAAVLLDGDDKPVDAMPADYDGIDFALMAAALFAEDAGKSDSWRALLEGKLIAAAMHSRVNFTY